MKVPPSLYLEKQQPWTKRHWIGLALILIVVLIVIPGIAILLPIWDIEPVEDTAMWIRADWTIHDPETQIT